jgi:hypothetical protein
MNKKHVQLVIDGEIWLQVPDFGESTPYDRHFVIRNLNNGHDIFIFGNGKNGARPSERYGSFDAPYKLQKVDEEELYVSNEVSNGKKPKKLLTGIYRAVVISNEDPDKKMRVQVKIDAIPEMGLLWASPVVPLKENERILPAVGELVWTSFQNGDPNQPLWLGKISEDEPPSFFYL